MALLRTLTHYVKDKHHFRGNEQAYTNKQDFTEFKNLLETYGRMGLIWGLKFALRHPLNESIYGTAVACSALCLFANLTFNIFFS